MSDNDKSKKKLSVGEFKQALRIFKFIKPYKITFLIGLVFLVLSSATSLVFPFAIGRLVDSANVDGHFNTEVLKQIGFYLIIILVLQSVFSFLRVILFAQVSERSMADIRKALYSKIISLPIPFFEERRVGELISRITNDISILQDALSITLAELFRQIAILIIGTIVIFVRSTELTLIVLATYPVIIIFAAFFGRYIKKLSKKTQDALAETNVQVDETFQTVQTVKAFANEYFEISKYNTSIAKVVKIALDTAKYRAAFISFIIFGIFGGILLVLWFGAKFVDQGIITVGELIEFMMYSIFIGASLGSLGDIYSRIIKAVGASEKVLDILEEENEVNVTDKKIDLKLNGNIEFNDVHFNYPSRADVDVLKGVTFNIKPGQLFALVGPSGSGKSTVIQLLMHFYKINNGSISIDNKPIDSYNLTELRSNIGIVPQEVILFGGSIKENIAYGNPSASEDKIVTAAQQANAWEFIKKFPEGLDTLVGERGVKLSGGQRQRIAIARAILKDPAILILDEATSSLDSESEKLVQEALSRLMLNRTTIVIAHRLSTIKSADSILVIENGEIIEQGTHSELAANTRGLYNHLLTLQLD